jgi:hypothetical protein
MKTAVEWLFEQLCSEKLSWNKDSNGKLFIDRITSDIFQQAKEMEKEQIIEAHGNKQKTKSDPDSIVTYGYTFTGEAYYNKTYKKTDK